MANFPIAKYKEDKLVELYYMTIGILLVTNENHTSINIHNEIVSYILKRSSSEPFHDLILDSNKFLDKEISIVEILLNSNNNKLNKSSSLWYLYKRLFILKYKASQEDHGYISNFIKVVLKSCELHPTNYYAWNFMRWLYKFLKFYNIKIKLDLINIIEGFCFKNNNDFASWSCYIDILTFQWDDLEFFKFEIQKFGLILPSNKPQESNHIDLLQRKLEKLINWINQNEIISNVSYESLRKIFKILESSNISIHLNELNFQIEGFNEYLSQRGIKFSLKNGWYELNENLDNDLILSQKIKRHINWIRLLNWINTNTKQQTKTNKH
ncbi:hypothetical protein BN7_6391 [Wickerhamomyces ciferrii]|uniref:Uncharacterized protein n=1 Tax=Wickerhamomyces ciferrii (strain ATCC 14091 / BCRC 22168 / CBS 111 / JCM 3599 / NBRC 0793 / NRRL Y-1031 F-60-10) TaxID=1206466 RepID=K0KXN6_WICCF|nr:uncharacterized protein BN7_6391 [Wickerhamomyces ciferrii]CCH46792.1 hypothetical protein BN7_6391 [Wickerhamomyces ciferrii]